MKRLMLLVLFVTCFVLFNCDGGQDTGTQTECPVCPGTGDIVSPVIELRNGHNAIDADGSILTGYTHRLVIYSNEKLDHDFSDIVIVVSGAIGSTATLSSVTTGNMDQVDGVYYTYEFYRTGQWQPNVSYIVTGTVKDLSGNVTSIAPSLVGWTN
jgi:hypothetical protein